MRFRSQISAWNFLHSSQHIVGFLLEAEHGSFCSVLLLPDAHAQSHMAAAGLADPDATQIYVVHGRAKFIQRLMDIILNVPGVVRAEQVSETEVRVYYRDISEREVAGRLIDHLRPDL